jgi:dCMP deaminase
MRPGWDEYFMEVARTVATRATCPRASVGAVLVREQRILTTGYNGAPRHVAHCTEVGCELSGGHCVRSTHAEANAVGGGGGGRGAGGGGGGGGAPPPPHGVKLDGASAYCTHQPCVNCAKLLISAGVTRIVYEAAYDDPFSQRLLAEAGVALVHFASLERANVASV